jgi:hypothetical protein
MWARRAPLRPFALKDAQKSNVSELSSPARNIAIVGFGFRDKPLLVRNGAFAIPTVRGSELLKQKQESLRRYPCNH